MSLGCGVAVSRSLSDLTVDHFVPQIGQAFRVFYPDYNPALILTEVVAATPAAAGLRQRFSLIFETEAGARYLTQAIHPLENATLGRLELFLVPLGPDERGRFRYEAVFS